MAPKPTPAVAAAPAMFNKDSTISFPALNNFSDIKFMNIQFPIFGNGIDDDDCLIKWKAEFGRGLRSCIILGATSFYERKLQQEGNSDVEEEEDQFLTDDQLKLRIIWTISCLISSSARHHFLKQIVYDHPNLQSVVLSDCKNQGKLSMDGEQLLEMRNSMDVHSLERTPLPDLSIKMLYLPVLELPASGHTMKGATLIMIRAVDDDDDDDDGLVMKKGSDGGDLLGGWFDGNGEDNAFDEAVREIMKVKKSYLMTINSF